VRLSDARYVICPMIAIFLLTNCGGSTTPATATGGQQNVSQTIHRRTSSCRCLYVANLGAPGSMTVYASGATGNAKPIQDISGSKTGLINPFGVAVDGSGDIYTTTDDDVIAVYAAGATGNVAPIREIIVNVKPYHALKGIAVDPINGDTYVANPDSNAILIYAASAHGKATPIGTIAGSQTGLNGPFGVALDKSENIYIANKENSSVTVYVAGSTGNVAPTQTIAGTRTELDLPEQLALDSNSNIYVANATSPSGNGSLTVYAAGANGDVAPTETIDGAKTELNLPGGIAVDSADNIYAANYTSSTITVYAAGSNGNVAPINTISGSETGLEGPRGILIH
jgi:6-phosphogluconolactonase (cycloisomerase 2 family)